MPCSGSGRTATSLTRTTTPPVTSDTLFDLASLTKVIATAPLAMQLVARAAPAAECAGGARTSATGAAAIASGVTIADLLEHCAGFMAWSDVFRRAESRREFAHEIATMPLEYRAAVASRSTATWASFCSGSFSRMRPAEPGRTVSALSRRARSDYTPAKAERRTNRAHRGRSPAARTAAGWRSA